MFNKILDLSRERAARKLAKELQLVPINRRIAALRLELMEMEEQRDRMEIELLGQTYHAEQNIRRKAEEAL